MNSIDKTNLVIDELYTYLQKQNINSTSGIYISVSELIFKYLSDENKLRVILMKEEK